MPTKIPQNQYPLLIQLINETYRDEIEIIADAAIQDDGTILAVALDGAKQLAIKITDDNIAIKLLNPNDIDPDGAQFSEKPDTIDRIAERVEPALQTHLDKWFRALRGAQEAATSYGDLQDRIAQIFAAQRESREEVARDFAESAYLAYLSGVFEAE